MMAQTIGALVQLDGIFYEWVEDRGPACCLLVAIDDAAGRVFMHFAPSENGFDLVDSGAVYHATEPFELLGSFNIDQH